ncbi:arsenite methyltransferase [SAR202 cluster bacterium AD-802-E10_MRT_200m]|nr:arsenite methyltransferase [SAR202 cluster bacterium AD-802-E10_MRT_200m]
MLLGNVNRSESFMNKDAQTLREYVRSSYGLRARQGLNCCDPSTQALPGIYSSNEVSTLPLEVLAVSAGCGNPTALANLKVGEIVLDLGSGGGIDCFLAAKQVGESGKIYGVDMTPDMIKIARRNAAVLGFSNVEFLYAEIEKIPLADSSVDVVISNCVICLSPEKDKVFAETFRLLRPGGRVHLSDMVTEEMLSEDIRKNAEAWAGCVAGADSLKVYLDRLTDAGFENIDVTKQPTKNITNGDESGVFSALIVAYKPG